MPVQYLLTRYSSIACTLRIAPQLLDDTMLREQFVRVVNIVQEYTLLILVQYVNVGNL